MSKDSRDEVSHLVDDLEATLEDLRRALEPSTRDRLPMPPSPRGILSFTDEYAIPTAIAVLEANIRALESLQKVIHVTNRGMDATETTRNATSRTRDVSQDAIARLERALTEIQTSFEDGALPENPEARQLLNEARSLRTEIDDRLGETSRQSRAQSPNRTRSDDRPIVIPVEADEEAKAEEREARELEDALAEEEIEDELDTIKRELDAVDDDEDET